MGGEIKLLNQNRGGNLACKWSNDVVQNLI